MTYGQYCRIEDSVGGIALATPRAFIRAARRLLSDKGKSRESRDQRHAWLRSGLAYRESALRLVRDFRL
jgi:hypothetical protein